MKNADLPAMPVTEEDYNAAGEYVLMQRGGLTKREYFAAEMAKCIDPPSDFVGRQQTQYSYSEWAGKAARMADALLAELERTK